MSIQNQWTPELALVLHRSGDNNSFSMTRHNITRSGMALGEYVSIEQCVSLLTERSAKDDAPIAITPQHLLTSTDKGMMWYKPAHQGILWFRYNQVELQLTVNYPALLFCLIQGTANKLSVYALGDDNYPTTASPIYNAPLMNVGINGLVCQGTASLPKEITPTQQCLTQIEETLFNSYFTHVNNDKTINSAKRVDTSDLVKFWQRKAKAGESINTDELVLKGTVSDVLQLLS